MKKMKRFLSLLICMVMLMSFLPMSASAEIYGITVQLPSKDDMAGKTAADIVKEISVQNEYSTVYVHSASVVSVNGDTIVAELVLRETDWFSDFSQKNPVSIQNASNYNEKVLDTNREGFGDYFNGYYFEGYQLRVRLQFDKPHTCNPTSVEAKPAVHNKDELKAAVDAHYKCDGCGKLFKLGRNGLYYEVTASSLLGETPQHQEGEPVQENVTPSTCLVPGSYEEVVYCSAETCDYEFSRTTKPLELADHTYKHVDAKPAVHTADERTGAVAEHYECEVCHEVFLHGDNGYVKVEASSLVGETPEHQPDEPVQEKVTPSTCKDAGSYEEVVYCSVATCGAELSRTTKPLELADHKYKHVDAKPAVHTKNELKASVKEHYECEVCHEVFLHGDNGYVKVEASSLVGETPEHTYGDKWYEHNGNHYQKCSVCEKVDNNGRHNFEPKYDDKYHWEECSVCKKERNRDEHDLDWVNTDADEHWQECDDCEYKTTHAAHVYDDDWKDEFCNTCNHKRAIHQHNSFVYAYTDASGHWKQCGDPECPDVEHSKTQKVDHRYGHGYWDPICDDCGFTRFYIVKFDVTNWYDYNDQRVDAGDTADRPHAPDTNGLTLDGWYTNPECTEKYDFTTPVNTSFTLFAKWVPITHDVTFNGNNFTVTIEGSEDEDNKCTVPENGEVEFTITADEGYEITEVKIDGQKVTLAENGEYTISNITSDKRVDITATPITYEVTFTGNNFTVAIGENEDVDKHTVNYKGEVEFTVTPDEGYKVTGVKVGEDTLTATGGVYTISNITSDKTVEISTERITYTINYDAKGGTGAPAAQIKNHGEVLTLSTTVPTREGYEFVCWNTMADYTGVDYEAGASYNHDGGCTLRAKWTEVYTISYELNGGALKTGETNPDKYTALTETFKLNNPEKENFTFAGWTEGNDTTPNTNVTIEKGSTGDRKYTAHWTQNSYTVVFYGNGGTLKAKTADEATATQVIPIGEEAALNENPFTRTGYTFAGWNTERDGSGKSYGDGEKVKNLTREDGAEVKLYAQWTQNSYTVKFDTNGKGTAPTAQTVGYGNKAAKPADPTAANYTFGGWYTDKECTYEYSFETPVTGDITLYAKWTKTIYKVTYDANGGTGEMPVVSVEAGEGHTLVANEFKAPAGKTFKCWKVGLKEYKAGEKIDVTENVTVKAVWKNKTASSDLDYVPAAGDNFPTFLWAGLLLFSVVALVEVVVLRRKRS